MTMPSVPPALSEPHAAWLMLVDDKSFPPVGFGNTDDRTQARLSAASTVAVGDTAFIYYMQPKKGAVKRNDIDPYKAIHFIARVVRVEFIDSGLTPVAARDVAPQKWYAHIDAVVGLREPINLDQIRNDFSDNDAKMPMLNVPASTGVSDPSRVANSIMKRVKPSATYSRAEWCKPLALAPVVG